jgi:hypothetical protein
MLNILHKIFRGKLDLLSRLLCATGTGRLCVHRYSGIPLQVGVQPFISKTGLDSEPRCGGVQITDQTRDS